MTTIGRVWLVCARWVGACVIAGSALLASRSAHAQQVTAPTRFTLPNGLEVLLEEDHRQKLVALRLSYAVGSRNDPPGQSGLAHLVEHMTYRGSRHLADGQLWHLYQLAGAGDMNGETRPDETVYHATVSSNALELALWLESERMAFTAERFDSAHVDIERGVVWREEFLRQGDDLALAYGIFSGFFGESHPYARPLDFSPKRPSLSLDQVRDFFLRGYRPDNARLILVGDFEPAAARALVERYFGPIRNPPLPKAALTKMPTRARPGVRVQVPATDKRKLLLAWGAPIHSLRERARLVLLARLLNEGFWHRSIREQRNLRTLRASLEFLQLGSLLEIHAAIERTAPQEDVEIDLRDALARLPELVTDERLASVRASEKLAWLSAWESSSEIAESQAEALVFYDRTVEPNDYASEVDTISSAELKAYAATLSMARATRAETVFDLESAKP